MKRKLIVYAVAVLMLLTGCTGTTALSISGGAPLRKFSTDGRVNQPTGLSKVI